MPALRPKRFLDRVPAKESKFPILLTIVLLALIINISRSILDLRKSDERVDNAQERINELAEQNDSLSQQIQYADTDDFLQKAALEDLNMVKPGYKILIINEKRPEDFAINQPAQDNTPDYKNWQLWMIEFGLNPIIL